MPEMLADPAPVRLMPTGDAPHVLRVVLQRWR